MKYNSKYNRWFTKEGLVYRWSKTKKKLVLCSLHKDKDDYRSSRLNGKRYMVHRAVYETFVGEIPEGFQIDHINTIKDDNRVDNLRAVTPKENMNNPLTKQKLRKKKRNRKNKVIFVFVTLYK